VTCSDLEAESSAVFSTVIGIIVRGIYPVVILRVNFGTQRRSLHPPPVAAPGHPRQIRRSADSCRWPASQNPLRSSMRLSARAEEYILAVFVPLCRVATPNGSCRPYSS
jgi:hypothetical protein